MFDYPGRHDLLYLMHEDSTTESKSIYRCTRKQDAVETKAKKFIMLRNDLKTDHIIAAELSLSQYSSSTANKEKFIKYLQEKAKVIPATKAYHANEGSPTEEDRHTSDLLPFRKMKLESFINQLQADKRLAKNIQKKFGNDAILILSNWSAGQAKNHELIKDIGMRRMLVKEGF